MSTSRSFLFGVLLGLVLGVCIGAATILVVIN